MRQVYTLLCIQFDGHVSRTKHPRIITYNEQYIVPIIKLINTKSLPTDVRFIMREKQQNNRAISSSRIVLL